MLPRHCSLFQSLNFRKSKIKKKQFEICQKCIDIEFMYSQILSIDHRSRILKYWLDQYLQ